MRHTLNGWSPDRLQNVMERMIEEAGLPMIDAHFDGDDLVAAEDADPAVIAAVVAYFAPRSDADKRAEFKQQRQTAVDAITVTTSTGKTFDGDETSQTRMSRAIIGLQAAGVPTINWTLADNAVAEVTVAELTEALILSGQAQAALWVTA